MNVPTLFSAAQVNQNYRVPLPVQQNFVQDDILPYYHNHHNEAEERLAEAIVNSFDNKDYSQQSETFVMKPRKQIWKNKYLKRRRRNRSRRSGEPKYVTYHTNTNE
jgi:hypothetical protein